MTITDMFCALKRVMEPFLVPVVKTILKKGADTNNFISYEAEMCFNAISAHCQDSKVLQVILMQNTNSRSHLQRLRMCQQLMNIAKQLGNNILFFKDNDKLIVQLAKYL
jgi:hypothetical protein